MDPQRRTSGRKVVVRRPLIVQSSHHFHRAPTHHTASPCLSSLALPLILALPCFMLLFLWWSCWFLHVISTGVSTVLFVVCYPDGG